MAINKKDTKAYRTKVRIQKVMGGLALSATAVFGHHVYTDIYIPDQAAQAEQSDDFERFFELLPSLDQSWDTQNATFRAIADLYRAQEKMSDVQFRHLVDNSPGVEITSILMGIAVIQNDTDLINYITTHENYHYRTQTHIRFGVTGADLAYIQNIHANTPYTSETAFTILNQALVRDQTEIAQWIKNTFSFETINIESHMYNVNDDYLVNLIRDLPLSSAQQNSILRHSTQRPLTMEYALDNYEYNDEELEFLFYEFARLDRTNETAYNVLLEHFTPSQEQIEQAYEIAYNDGNVTRGFNLLMNQFQAPESIVHTRFLNLIERNRNNQIVDLFQMIEDPAILAQGYVNAANSGHSDILFTYDISGIVLDQSTINQAFQNAADEGEYDTLRHIASSRHVSPETARTVLQDVIRNGGYNSTHFARELNEIITEFNRNTPVITQPIITAPNAHAAPISPPSP